MADKKTHLKKNESNPKNQRKPRNRQNSEKAATENLPKDSKHTQMKSDTNLKIIGDVNHNIKEKQFNNKVITSNWSKYEEEIKSYDKLQDEQDLGANFEDLINTPLSLGGHFQFKHEKSWDSSYKQNKYSKYFEPNMERLALSVSSIPLYELIEVPKSVFDAASISEMEARANHFKISLAKFDENNSSLCNVVMNDSSPQACLLKNLKSLISDECSDVTSESSVLVNETRTDVLSQGTSDVNKLNIDDITLLDDNDLKVSAQKSTDAKPTEDDLEQWLDDFLDS